VCVGLQKKAKRQQEDEMEEEEEALQPEELLLYLHSALKPGETVASALRRSTPSFFFYRFFLRAGETVASSLQVSPLL